MRYFLDTEFLDDGMSIMPISLALVAEDGRELYVEFCFDSVKAEADAFIQRNVLPHLKGGLFLSRDEVALKVKNFVGDDPNPQFWAWYGAYDWVLFCQVFGALSNLPNNFPGFIRDLKQLCEEDQVPPAIVPPPPAQTHDALIDARWLRDAFLDVSRWRASRLEKHLN